MGFIHATYDVQELSRVTLKPQRASYAEVTFKYCSESRAQESESVKEQKDSDVSVKQREDCEDDNIRKIEDKHSQAEWTVVSQMRKKNVKVIRGKRETSSGSLKGVESRRAYWAICIGNVEEDSSKGDIKGYLSENGVKPMYVFLLNSKVKDTVSARIRDKQKVLDPPVYVKVRSWIRASRGSNSKSNSE